MSQRHHQPDEEVRDFDAALELISELNGRIVAIGMLTPPDSPRMTAVVRGTLKTSAASKPPTDSRVARTAFFGLEDGPPNMGHWGSQGFYVSEPVFEYAKRTHGGVIVVLRDIVFRLSLDEQDARLEGNDWLKGATLIRPPLAGAAARKRQGVAYTGGGALGDRGPRSRADGRGLDPGRAARLGSRPLRVVLGNADRSG